MLKARIAVLVSGGGTNLQALIDAEKSGIIKSGTITAVISSKPGVYALERAAAANIPGYVVNYSECAGQNDFEAKLISILNETGADLIILAGFMRILSKDFVSRYPERIINIHPSLIPAFCGDGFYGLHVHEAVLNYGVKLTGATVHFVNEITDGGRIILQKAVEVKENDTPEILQKRVMEEAEWQLLPLAAEKVAAELITEKTEAKTLSTSREKYNSPLSSRYASDEMQYLFSDDFKFRTWRRLWISLAKAEKALGLDITDEQIAELEAHAGDIDYETAEARERIVRHDVMSHVYAYGKQCPTAEPIIHLGATSCYVCDNTDVIIMKQASELILKKLGQVIRNLSDFADKYKALPCLAYTHLQPAQLTTVGKRACLWINELLSDVRNLEFQLSGLQLLGSKGTTGTQASFMELFEGDEDKICRLEDAIAKDMGFSGCVPVSGQTYSRKTDSYFLSVLSGIAQSAYKFSNDLRILQSFEEVEEPFEKNQIGSSAMPYKRNPMRSERISSLARYVILDAVNPAMTAGTQWFERTLDDSANKRISVAEAFLAVDAILNIYINVSSGLVVYDKVITRRVMEKLPYMATENIMMQAVKKGANRQELHEQLRVHSQAAATAVKLEGLENDLIDRIANDPAFMLTKEEICSELEPSKYIGRSVSQVSDFIANNVRPVLDRIYTDTVNSELRV